MNRVVLLTSIYTSITFIAVAVQFKKRWRQRAFWGALAVLLALHLVLYVTMLRRLPDLPLIALFAILMLETQLLCYLLDKAGFALYR